MRVSERLQQSLMAAAMIVAAIATVTPAAMGQVSTNQGQASATAQNQPSHWLERAREAMEVKNYFLAEQCIQMAESKMQPGMMLDYTPTMAKAELTARRASGGIAGTVSQTLSDATGVAEKTADKFTNAGSSIAALTTETVETAIEGAEQKVAIWTDQPVSPEVSLVRDALLKARQELAIGNTDGAKAAMNSVAGIDVDFSKVGDTTMAIESLINRQETLTTMGQANDPTYNQQAANFLMKQAEAMVKYQDFKTARTLVELAQAFPVQAGNGVTTPDRLLTIIEVAETQLPGRSAVANTEAAPKPELAQSPADVATPATMSPKQEVMRLLSQAQLAIDQQRFEAANQFVSAAKAYQVPDSQFSSEEMLPWQMELKIQNALNLQQYSRDVKQAAGPEDQPSGVVTADYDPSMDSSAIVQVANNEPIGTGTQNGRLRGEQLYQSGLQAAAAGQADQAREYLQLAMNYPEEMGAVTAEQIQGKLTEIEELATSQTAEGELAAAKGSESATNLTDENMIAQVSAQEELRTGELSAAEQDAFRAMQSEVFRERQAAEKLLEDRPSDALERMTMLRNRIAGSDITPTTQRPLLKMVDRDISEMQVYIEKNLPEIRNREENQSRRESVKRTAQRRLDIEQQLQALFEDFNDLMDEERYAEAGAIVQQATDLAPDNEVVAALRERYKFKYRGEAMAAANEMKEEGFWNALRETTEDSVPYDGIPLKLDPDLDGYKQRGERRLSKLADGQYASEADRMIWNKLRNVEVQGEYRGTLADAVDQLSRQAGINIVFDTIALQAEGIAADQMVNVPILNPISLQSALNVILGSSGLEFMVENEVIKVTSRDAKRSKLVPKTYYIGDLVMPMNNYQNPLNMQFASPGRSNGYAGGVMNVGGNGPLTVNQPQSGGGRSQLAMAQQIGGNVAGNPFGGFGGGGGGYGLNGPNTTQPVFGSVGNQPRGGVTEQDFEPLIELIQGTVATDSWQETGQGEGTVRPFVPNLSLIVSQTQEIQDEIQDLLKKLRELNDVQIVIEVRFVTIQDDFFERIGVDFNFGINDSTDGTAFDDDVQPKGTIVGLSSSDASGTGQPFLPTSNSDIQFSQGSFNAAVPNFGGFDAGNAASLGFAILSDIEVYFLIQASKGSSRANILQAPTVTMFNGQSASVTDGSQRPFVTSVTPVVGDFAVAHAPVITILPDGTSLNVSAVVSNDRRSVRLSLVPFFSQVTDVETFTFTGSTRTERSTNSFLDDLLDAADPTNADDSDDELQTTTTGVTIQLPILATTSVNTVVSVPDGGTVLLGGIKRMREERQENGVPFLSSVPYINRLFKNVGLGRETTNLMMMVTPRIIIAEEEEERQIGAFGGN